MNTSKRDMTYNRIFLDTNILIDLLLERKPFQHEARSIFELGVSGEAELFASSLSFMNTHYTINKTFGQKRALEIVGQLRKLVNLLTLNEGNIDEAILNPGADFEDAVQYFSAKAANCDVIISRDRKGFKGFDIPCLTPKEFLDTN